MFDSPAHPIEALDRSRIVARNKRNASGDDDVEITINDWFGISAKITLTPFCADLLIAQIIKAKHGPDCTAKI